LLPLRGDLGGVSIAMAADVAETTQIERPPREREEVPVQLSRLLDAHQIIIRRLASWLYERQNSATTAPMIFSSAKSCAQTSFKRGS
jgi:DNA-binding ferritin-like protein